VELAKIEKIDEGRRRREADLRGALVNPDGGAAPVIPAPEAAPDDEKSDAKTPANPDSLEDYQLARAVDLLRGFYLFQNRVVN
jgi:carboxyl-terminal processing protease